MLRYGLWLRGPVTQRGLPICHARPWRRRWAATIPIGQMKESERASSRLFGQDVVAVRVAETRRGVIVGYAGVYRNPQALALSVLVHRDHRRRGLARQLVERVFQLLPDGTDVLAWVSASNEASLKVMPAMGFVLDRIIEDRGRTVQVYTRAA